MSALRVLDIGETGVCRIEGFDKLQSLMMLNLSKTNISEISDLDHLSSLKLIKLVECNIAVINEKSFIGVNNECIVDLSFNPLETDKINVQDNIQVVLNFNEYPSFDANIGDELIFLEEQRKLYFEHLKA